MIGGDNLFLNVSIVLHISV